MRVIPICQSADQSVRINLTDMGKTQVGNVNTAINRETECVKGWLTVVKGRTEKRGVYFSISGRDSSK